MENEVKSIFPREFCFLSGSMLKLLAVLTMLMDHFAKYVLPTRFNPLLIKVGAHSITLCKLMVKLGRIAFPLYCFLLVEGFLHTHDRKKYGINLFVFAVISEIPWNLMHCGELTYEKQNVFFTLFLGYLALCALEKFKDNWFYQLLSICVLLGVSFVAKCDYGALGFAFIVMIYALREQKLPQLVVGSTLLSSRWVAGLAFIPINMYNGKRGFIKGKFLKYTFYAIYPIHMLIIYLINVL